MVVAGVRLVAPVGVSILESSKQLGNHAIDIATTHGDDEITAVGEFCGHCWGVVPERHVVHHVLIGERVGYQDTRHARLRVFAGGVNIEHHDLVGKTERLVLMHFSKRHKAHSLIAEAQAKLPAWLYERATLVLDSHM